MTGPGEAGAAAFTELRPLLFAIAYRMLGSVSDAEDIVQEAFLRYHKFTAGGQQPESAKAWLSAVTTRLCIDHARSARVRRETYVGQWLPEPLLTDLPWAGPAGAGPATAGPDPAGLDPAGLAEQADTLSMAFLLLLERLSPVERAVFLLHDVFGYGYDEVAAVVGRGEAACRQVGYRARKHVAEHRRRHDASRRDSAALAGRFFAAMADGDLDGLVAMLAADAVVTGDSAGIRPSWPRPIAGRDNIARLLAALGVQLRQVGGTVSVTGVNGQPGAVITDADGQLISVMALEISGGLVTGVRSVIARDKLRHLGPLADLPALLARARQARTGGSGADPQGDALFGR